MGCWADCCSLFPAEKQVKRRTSLAHLVLHLNTKSKSTQIYKPVSDCAVGLEFISQLELAFTSAPKIYSSDEDPL